ncbi:hypothetical protein RhiirA4_284637, partial [Rhizophagus irregularis]
NTYKEKFKMLDVEAELKLSIIAELFSLKGLKGSIEYLTDVKESFKSVKSNLIYKITSFEENLDICRDDVKACISTDEFSNNHATHVIIGINFKNVKEPNLGTHFSIKLFGDIPHNKQLPQSFNEARKIIIGLPSYIKKLNNGKGVPIEYILYPISDLADLFAQNTNVNFMETSLSEATILKVEQMFDNLSEFKQRLNDLFNDTNEAQIILPDLTPVFNEIKDRMQECSKYPVIQHYINGKLNSDNYYDDSKVLFTSNVVKFDPVPSKPKNTPNKKTQLVMPCPQDCPIVDCNWRCLKCEQNIEYGYNKRLYCDCGESDIAHCKFRCNSSHHTRGYVPFESDTLIKMLPSAPPEEINILLLGETGVGKSTFINAFVNYLKFDSLSDAKSRNMGVFIPSKFTVTDENCEMKTIKLGDDDSNERLGSVGESSTIWCKSYVFHAPGNQHIRLIDTPGIGDTRGLNEDKKNFEKIMISISKYKFLNGIYNIVFCFTNARGTFYRPGDTLPSLKKQIDELKERSNVEIKIDKDTTYCFDNESFRFLAALKEGIAFTETDELCFAESWKKSVNESRRLIEHIAGCKPHQVEDTISLNNARSIVMLLSKPLAEVGQLIQTNIKLIKEKQSEIENSDKTIEDLKDQLYIPQIDLEPIQLGYPRTVCTNGSCVKTLKINETTIKIDYIQHCCKRCYVPFNNYLKLCWAMKFIDGTCKECGCERNKHMHISYENKQITYNIVNEDVNSEILKNKSDQDAKKAMIKECEERLTQLKGEQNIINEISIKFAQFLRQNAIASFNDAYAEYLDLFVNEEKIKKSA